jgi:hypothetical protein
LQEFKKRGKGRKCSEQIYAFEIAEAAKVCVCVEEERLFEVPQAEV